MNQFLLEPGTVQTSLQMALSPLFLIFVCLGTAIALSCSPFNHEGDPRPVFLVGLTLTGFGILMQVPASIEREIFSGFDALMTLGVGVLFIPFLVFASLKMRRDTWMFWFMSLTILLMSASPLFIQIQRDYAAKANYATAQTEGERARPDTMHRLSQSERVVIRKVSWLDPHERDLYQNIWSRLTLDVSGVIWRSRHEPLPRPLFGGSEALAWVELNADGWDFELLCGYRAGEVVHVGPASAPAVSYEVEMKSFCPDPLQIRESVRFSSLAS